MRPNKIGGVAKLHAPQPEENPNQLYVVLEIIEDEERPRADIKALKTGLSLPPIKTVKLNDLVVKEIDTADLVGHSVTINKANYSQATGEVVKINEQKKMIDLTKGVKGVETNVCLTIEDEYGKKHTGLSL